MSVRWSCSECGGTGVRNLGTRGYCAAHLSELYSRFDPVVFGLNGVMIQAGKMRPDWGPAFCDVECVACATTEVGIVGEHCGGAGGLTKSSVSGRPRSCSVDRTSTRATNATRPPWMRGLSDWPEQ